MKKHIKRLMLVAFIVIAWFIYDLLNRDSDIVFYASSNIFMDGEDGRTSGTGKIGQYRVIGGGGSGGCCPSSESYLFKGKPKGAITVYWQAINYKNESSTFYYAYHPNPTFEFPRKTPGHGWYVVFYSFGHLALEAVALKNNHLNYPIDDDAISGELEYQVGEASVFYYKIYARTGNFGFSTITQTPFEEFQTIEGIEITRNQYRYIIDNKYLDENAPDLTPKQLKYIREREAMK